MTVSQDNPQAPVALQAIKLECTRGYRELFSELSFQLKPGEILQIDGHNGSGKTSLLRILCGLSLPNEGEVRWCGLDTRQHRQEYYADMQYVGHINGIKGDLTPRENLQMAQCLSVASHEISLDDALEQLGIGGYIDMPSRTMSAGQQRRVALARLLTTRARLWILDEPFTSLDKQARGMVESMLEQHAARDGMTVITTHQRLQGENYKLNTVNLD
ncbi:MAG: cytochrome c biogenesis heme-transporting ATPase CcmA [Gammaproteobacteria bacterium]|nr:MAG: cytochrome c biogenesis heme-transporting ATPase CcmA [Gammaproteobacteria bacterium]